MPAELHDLIWDELAKKLDTVNYERVIMTLGEVLSGDFFYQYVKSGKMPFEIVAMGTLAMHCLLTFLLHMKQSWQMYLTLPKGSPSRIWRITIAVL